MTMPHYTFKPKISDDGQILRFGFGTGGGGEYRRAAKRYAAHSRRRVDRAVIAEQLNSGEADFELVEVEFDFGRHCLRQAPQAPLRGALWNRVY